MALHSLRSFISAFLNESTVKKTDIWSYDFVTTELSFGKRTKGTSLYEEWCWGDSLLNVVVLSTGSFKSKSQKKNKPFCIRKQQDWGGNIREDELGAEGDNTSAQGSQTAVSDRVVFLQPRQPKDDRIEGGTQESMTVQVQWFVLRWTSAQLPSIAMNMAEAGWGQEDNWAFWINWEVTKLLT